MNKNNEIGNERIPMIKAIIEGVYKTIELADSAVLGKKNDKIIQRKEQSIKI